jgi:predicted protein tyrosine phosphatase
MPIASVKRFKPPNLTLASSTKPSLKRPIEIERSAASDDDARRLNGNDSDGNGSPDILSSPESSLVFEDASDELNKDLVLLEQLRQKVQTSSAYRRLRSNRSLHSLPKVELNTKLSAPPWKDDTQEPDTPASASSSYFTPVGEVASPQSAHYIGTAPIPTVAAVPTVVSRSVSTSVVSPAQHELPLLRQPQSGATFSPTTRSSQPIDLSTLAERLESHQRPILIDTRTPAAHLNTRIADSISIAIPSLILKRCRKPGGGLNTLEALRQFITTEQGKMCWDQLIAPGGAWDGDIVLYDEQMDETAVAWSLIPVLSPLLSFGSVDYIPGGIVAARNHWRLGKHIISSSDQSEPLDTPSSGTGEKTSNSGGVFAINTSVPYRSKTMPELESSSPYSPTTLRSPRPLNISTICDSSPSPPPSHIAFQSRPSLAGPNRRPSVPALKRLDTSSIERLNVPKLTLKTRSATLAVPSLSIATSPTSHNNHHSNILISSSPTSSISSSPTYPGSSSNSIMEFTPPRTPVTPRAPSSPRTAKPEFEHMEMEPPTSSSSCPESPFPHFNVSTILPSFLYLGPEPSSPEHVLELKSLGVKRILNIAIECGEDDHGLGLKAAFDKYDKIPMRDTVEEDNIARGVIEVCDILDDARLHSAPTYVHCKAGKSRSVTAVIAYLIHANHWTLSKAYTFVMERRKGISPNIGFVSELMSFEEMELGGKSVGVVKGSAGHGQGHGYGHGHGASNKLMNHQHHVDNAPNGGSMGADDQSQPHVPGSYPSTPHAPNHTQTSSTPSKGWRPMHHTRESLPPVFTSSGTDQNAPGPMSADGMKKCAGM